MNKLRNILKESLLCVRAIYERNLTITDKGIDTLTDTAETEILKEFVRKDNLPTVEERFMAFDAIEDAIENRRLANQPRDKGLDIAKIIVGIIEGKK